MPDDTWVKSYRKFTEWEWYKTPGMYHLFHHLIYKANHKPNRWKGIEIQRGQIITGRNKLAEETGLSPQQIRTCLSRLEKTGELTSRSTNRFSIITICNYDKYQPDENNINQPIPNKQPASNQQATTPREIENDKNEKETKYSSEFLGFWDAYPKKKSKDDAYKAWRQVKPSNGTREAIIKAIEWQKKSDDWTRDGGKYIPYPGTYLRDGGWKDEPTKNGSDSRSRRNLFLDIPGPTGDGSGQD